MNITGFFSYAHADDAFGFLSHLKEDLCTEFNIISGSTLDLFIDRDSISWGENWRNSISSGINNAGFFIPILSPNYFISGACRAELAQYIGKSQELRAEELLLPLLLVDVKPDSPGSDASLVSKILEYQYLDIRNLRYLDRGSGRYVRIVHDAAQRLWDANTRLTSMVVTDSKSSICNRCSTYIDESDSNDLPNEPDGFILESAKDFQPTLTEMTDSAQKINADITAIGECVSKTNDQIEREQNGGCFNPSVALAITGKLAAELTPVSSNYAEHANQFLSSVNKTERVLTPLIQFWIESDSGKEELNSFRTMIAATEDARTKVQSFKDTIKPAKRLSRSLLKTMQSIESSTSVCLAAMDIVIGWKKLLTN